MVVQNDSACCMTSGLVGATKNINPSENQRQKLNITVDAMNVLPSPVGKVTKVFSNRADLTILNQYVLNVLSAGYTHVDMVDKSS